MQHITYLILKKSFSKRDTFSLKLVYIEIATLNLSLISSFKPDMSKALPFEYMCACGEFTKAIL